MTPARSNAFVALSTLLALPMLALACGSPPSAEVAPPPPPVATAGAPIVVPLAAKSGSSLSGEASFTPVEGGVKVVVRVAGAPPGEIATHVHETGDCSSPDGKSAGGHFNPESKPHGFPTSAEHHLGDLGNIVVRPDGTGSTEVTVRGANLRDSDAESYVGRAIIVHAKRDDGGQPVGNAGDRIGCGVIAKR